MARRARITGPYGPISKPVVFSKAVELATYEHLEGAVRRGLRNLCIIHEPTYLGGSTLSRFGGEAW